MCWHISNQTLLYRLLCGERGGSFAADASFSAGAGAVAVAGGAALALAVWRGRASARGEAGIEAAAFASAWEAAFAVAAAALFTLSGAWMLGLLALAAAAPALTTRFALVPRMRAAPVGAEFARLERTSRALGFVGGALALGVFALAV